MTTAAETVRNIISLSPVIDVRRNCPELTAEMFVDSNFKHIVNRRLVWSKVQPFVNRSLYALAQSISGNLTGESVAWAIEVTIENVRDSVNRRRKWSEVRPSIVSDVIKVIRAAEDLIR